MTLSLLTDHDPPSPCISKVIHTKSLTMYNYIAMLSNNVVVVVSELDIKLVISHQINYISKLVYSYSPCFCNDRDLIVIDTLINRI